MVWSCALIRSCCRPCPSAVFGFRDLLNQFQVILIPIENRQGFRVKEQLEVSLLDPFLDATFRGFIATPGVLGVPFGL